MRHQKSASKSLWSSRALWTCLLMIFSSLFAFPLLRQNDAVYAALLSDIPPLFSDYSNWHKSTLKNPDNNSTFELFQSMARYTFPIGIFSHSTRQKFSFIDINDDGPADFLFHATYVHSSFASYFALMINKGNNDFELIYRCVRNSNSYYGSCALGATPIGESNMLVEIGNLISYAYGADSVDSQYKPTSFSVDINSDGLVDLITNHGQDIKRL